MPKTKTSHLKWCKAVKKKAEMKAAELVERCDHCGKPLGRTCARTTGSAVCALNEGLVVRSAVGFAGPWAFFCCKDCAESYARYAA